jgi:hypothetical protein
MFLPEITMVYVVQGSKCDFNFGGQLQKSGGQTQILVAKVKQICR